jgi:hypothetical protein
MIVAQLVLFQEFGILVQPKGSLSKMILRELQSTIKLKLAVKNTSNRKLMQTKATAQLIAEIKERITS